MEVSPEQRRPNGGVPLHLLPKTWEDNFGDFDHYLPKKECPFNAVSL